MGQVIDLFAGLNKQLEGLIQQRNDPNRALAIQQIERNRTELQRSQLVSGIIEQNQDIDVNDPGALTDFIGQIASIDGRYIGAYINAVGQEATKTQALADKAKALQASRGFAKELEDANLSFSAKAVNAAAQGAAIPDSAIANIFKREFGDPSKLPDAAFISLREKFTGQSLNDYINTRDFNVLKYDPLYLERMKAKLKFDKLEPINPSDLTKLEGQVQGTEVFKNLLEQTGTNIFGYTFGGGDEDDKLNVLSQIGISGISTEQYKAITGKEKLTDREKLELRFINESYLPTNKRFQSLLKGEQVRSVNQGSSVLNNFFKADTLSSKGNKTKNSVDEIISIEDNQEFFQRMLKRFSEGDQR